MLFPCFVIRFCIIDGLSFFSSSLFLSISLFSACSIIFSNASSFQSVSLFSSSFFPWFFTNVKLLVLLSRMDDYLNMELPSISWVSDLIDFCVTKPSCRLWFSGHYLEISSKSFMSLSLPSLHPSSILLLNSSMIAFLLIGLSIMQFFLSKTSLFALLIESSVSF